MSTISIYVNFASQPCRALRKICDLNGITDKINWPTLELLKREHFSESFTKINPASTVPVLVDTSPGIDGNTDNKSEELILTESTAIAQYLCDKFNLTGKFGIPCVKVNPLAHYQVINALHNHHNVVRAASMEILDLWRPAALTGQLPDPKDRIPLDLEKLKERIDFVQKHHYPLIENKLRANNGWLCSGNNPTVADVFAWMELWQFTKGDRSDDDLNTFQMIDYEQFPFISAWLKKLEVVLFDEQLWEACRGFIQLGRIVVPQAAILANKYHNGNEMLDNTAVNM
jgi:glutathione S-transferase